MAGLNIRDDVPLNKIRIAACNEPKNADRKSQPISAIAAHGDPIHSGNKNDKRAKWQSAAIVERHS
ncbi:hypothetical protein AB1286_21135 [Trinickia sp. NRRL B-1857]|uniref:hypothetical protein n=1 Tax=Trinickia sp. NRRL B-1857 TaxID=3162879 RepID=UPI003D2C136C